MVMVKTSRS